MRKNRNKKFIAVASSLALSGCVADIATPTIDERPSEEQAVNGYNQAAANLSGYNLSGANLSGFNLSGANLAGYNLSAFNLSAANLSGANLSGYNLSGYNTAAPNLSAANLSGYNLSAANLSGFNLSAANLSGANLSAANLSAANLSGANLSGANLSAANLSGANLSGANLTGANLSKLQLANIDLSRSNLSGANLSAANLSGANLSGANLSVADARSATGTPVLTNAIFYRTGLGSGFLAGMSSAQQTANCADLGGGSGSGSGSGSGTGSGSVSPTSCPSDQTQNAGSRNGTSELNVSGRPVIGTPLAGAQLGTAFAHSGVVNTNPSAINRSKEALMTLGILSTDLVQFFGANACPNNVCPADKSYDIAIYVGKFSDDKCAAGQTCKTASAGETVELWEALFVGKNTYKSFALGVPPGTPTKAVKGFTKAIARFYLKTPSASDAGQTAHIRNWDADPSSALPTNFAVPQQGAQEDYPGFFNVGYYAATKQVTVMDSLAVLRAFITSTTNNVSVMVDWFASIRKADGSGSIVLSQPSIPKFLGTWGSSGSTSMFADLRDANTFAQREGDWYVATDPSKPWSQNLVGFQPAKGFSRGFENGQYGCMQTWAFNPSSYTPVASARCTQNRILASMTCWDYSKPQVNGQWQTKPCEKLDPTKCDSDLAFSTTVYDPASPATTLKCSSSLAVADTNPGVTGTALNALRAVEATAPTDCVVRATNAQVSGLIYTSIKAIGDTYESCMISSEASAYLDAISRN